MRVKTAGYQRPTPSGWNYELVPHWYTWVCTIPRLALVVSSEEESSDVRKEPPVVVSRSPKWGSSPLYNRISKAPFNAALE